MGLNLFQSLSFGFRNVNVSKNTSAEGKYSVNPKESMKANRHVNVGEEFENEKGEKQVETGDSSACRDNFINILRAEFFDSCYLPKKLQTQTEKLCIGLLYKKAARKMLMKLIPRRFLIFSGRSSPRSKKGTQA